MAAALAAVLAPVDMEEQEADTVLEAEAIAVEEVTETTGTGAVPLRKNLPLDGLADTEVRLIVPYSGIVTHFPTGMGRTTSNDTMTTEAGRDQLFGNARQRYETQQPPQGGNAYGQSGQSSQSGAYGSSSGTDMPGGYGAYEDRQLTAEEQEEEDVNATKQEIKFIKQQDVSSTRNALRLAQQAEETGRDTLARLGAQGERIHNTERNLDLASSQNRIAEEKGNLRR